MLSHLIIDTRLYCAKEAQWALPQGLMSYKTLLLHIHLYTKYIYCSLAKQYLEDTADEGVREGGHQGRCPS